MSPCHAHVTLTLERDMSACLAWYYLVLFYFRDCEDEEVHFDADSFMDTVGNLLGEAHFHISYKLIKQSWLLI